MDNGLLLTFPPSPTPISGCSCSSIFVPHLQFIQLRTSHFPFTSHNHHLRISLTLTPKFSKWDSNADTNVKFRFNEEEEEEEEEEIFTGNLKNKKKKRRWWSQKPPKGNKKKPAFFFYEAIESIMIFKVFKSFGWFLPIIIISFLLSTGLKAFLMTSALYLALSVLFLAFEKLWGMTQSKPIRRARMRRKVSSVYASSVQMEDGEGEEVQNTRKAEVDNPSLVGSDNGSVNKGIQNVPDFGGWDFLDEARPMRGASRVTSESQRTKEKLSGNGKRVISKSQRTKDGMLSGNGRRSDIPLLLRLLIAIFPFIGFWAKMFW